MKEIHLEFVNKLSPIEEVYGVPVGDNMTMFKGVAITKGVTMNGRNYTVEVLKSIADQLKGLPVMYGMKFAVGGFEHNKENAAAVGSVVDSWYNANKRRVEYIAKVMNTAEVPDIREKINEGIVRFVSIGGNGELQESGDFLEVKKISLSHLSLVAVPGDPNAAIIDIIQENYKCFGNVCIPYYGCTRLRRTSKEARKRLIRIGKKR